MMSLTLRFETFLKHLKQFLSIQSSGLSKQSIKELEEFADKMATTRRRLEKVALIFLWNFK